MTRKRFNEPQKAAIKELPEYPIPYWREVPIYLKGKVQMFGNKILVNINFCPLSIWYPYHGKVCPTCLTTVMIAIIMMPGAQYSGDWFYADLCYAGWHPACHCKPAKKHFKEISSNYSVLQKKIIDRPEINPAIFELKEKAIEDEDDEVPF